MSDVFISYADEDRDRAMEVAAALQRVGWSVWWERKTGTGQPFDQTVEREFASATSVIVLWSKHSVESDAIRREAAAASERGALVAALIDDVPLPVAVRRAGTTAHLNGWQGEATHPGFRVLYEGVASAVDRRRQSRSAAVPGESAPPQGLAALLNPRLVAAILAAILLGLAISIFWDGRPSDTLTTLSPITGMPGRRPSGGGGTAPSAGQRSYNATASGLADLVVGTYVGDVIGDARGGARSQVVVLVTKVDGQTVRVSSDYSRLGVVDIPLTRVNNMILSAAGNSSFLVDAGATPVALNFNFRGEVAYQGTRQ